jgi:hypothetical protein
MCLLSIVLDDELGRFLHLPLLTIVYILFDVEAERYKRLRTPHPYKFHFGIFYRLLRSKKCDIGTIPDVAPACTNSTCPGILYRVKTCIVGGEVRLEYYFLYRRYNGDTKGFIVPASSLTELNQYLYFNPSDKAPLGGKLDKRLRWKLGYAFRGITEQGNGQGSVKLSRISR